MIIIINMCNVLIVQYVYRKSIFGIHIPSWMSNLSHFKEKNNNCLCFQVLSKYYDYDELIFLNPLFSCFFTLLKVFS